MFYNITFIFHYYYIILLVPALFIFILTPLFSPFFFVSLSYYNLEKTLVHEFPFITAILQGS